MALEKQLSFLSDIGRQKPRTINKNDKCPFCDRGNLKDILAEDPPILWLKNKYPVLENAFQTVLVETYTCQEELSTYTKEHLYRVFDFGIKKWTEMERSGQFSSVLFFKNHGPFSGGTVSHPHMQIVGLKDVDCRENICKEHFRGLLIAQKKGVEFNLSTHPRVGFYEFNICQQGNLQTEIMADFIQLTAHYILNHFNGCKSYNIFFYRLEGKIAVKIIPRYITSPLFIGYSIPQVSDRINQTVEEVKNYYL